MSQNIIYGFKSDRQVNYKPRTENATFRPPHARENPQVLGLALTLHHDTRCEEFCIPYVRTMQIETSLANAVEQNTQEFEGTTILEEGCLSAFCS